MPLTLAAASGSALVSLFCMAHTVTSVGGRGARVLGLLAAVLFVLGATMPPKREDRRCVELFKNVPPLIAAMCRVCTMYQHLAKRTFKRKYECVGEHRRRNASAAPDDDDLEEGLPPRVRYAHSFASAHALWLRLVLPPPSLRCRGRPCRLPTPLSSVSRY